MEKSWTDLGHNSKFDEKAGLVHEKSEVFLKKLDRSEKCCTSPRQVRRFWNEVGPIGEN